MEKYIYFLCVFSSFQTLTTPAPFADETSCQCQAPHEKLTIAQARLGTPGMWREPHQQDYGCSQSTGSPLYLSMLTCAFHLEAEKPAWYLVLSGNGEESSNYRAIIFY